MSPNHSRDIAQYYLVGLLNLKEFLQKLDFDYIKERNERRGTEDDML